MVNFAASRPPLMLKVSVVPASGSLPVTVITALLFSATLAAAALGLAPPWLTKQLIDKGLVAGDAQALWLYAGAMFAVGLAALGSWVVNVVGSFLLGMVVGSLQGVTALVLGTGFLGGFTTFSTFTLESARLAHERRLGAAAMLALSGLVTSVAAAALGWALVG